MKRFQKVGAGLLAVLGLSSGAVMAQTTATYSDILAGLDSSAAVAAIIGAGVIVAGVGFAKWATKKVARFFG